MGKRALKGIFTALFTLIPAFSCLAQVVTVPAIIIPARTFPGSSSIKGVVVPGKDTPFGRLDDIVLPDIWIPGIVLPAVDTSKNYKTVEDIRYKDVQRIVTLKRDTVTIQKSLPLEARIEKYLQRMPSVSSPVLDLYARFDLDSSMSVSLHELQCFTTYIVRCFQYRSNDTALSPNDFFVQKGGDCEDFAIMTSEFLIFWGYDSYIAAFHNSRVGHAICLFRLERIPKGYLSFDLESSSDYSGVRVPSGSYVPIDYNYVGGFSSATEANMTLTGIYRAPDLIGQVM